MMPDENSNITINAKKNALYSGCTTSEGIHDK